jgi:hypothetical protein
VTEAYDRKGLRLYAPALIALAIPVGFLLWQFTFQYGWLEMAVNGAIIFWPAVLVWLIALIVALRRRHWWALLSAPLALYPIIGVGALLYQCSRGNCL